ncbi:MAG: signal peptidase I [Clostridia bacterium]|nr:signal peptidase I [Clostridia bacterium]
MKKAFDVVKKVAVGIVFCIAVFMMIFTIVSVTTFDRNDRDIFGYKIYTVLSDSMAATDFDAGSVVIMKEVDPSTLKEGDIISYISQNTENYGEVVTHKIRKLTKDAGGEPGFVTYGTTTDTDDELIVTYPYITGKYQTHISGVGHFFEYLRTPVGYITCIFIPFALLMLYQGINCVKLFRRYKKEQMEELQAEKDQLAAEREENMKMLAELKALKEQLAANSSEVQTQKEPSQNQE